MSYFRNIIVKNSNQKNLFLIEGIIEKTYKKIENKEPYNDLWFYNCINLCNKINLTYTLNNSFGRNIQKRLPEAFFILNNIYKK